MNKPCNYCGQTHTGTCPRVKAIEYWPDGTVKRVELRDETTDTKREDER
jgi:hypothetical protein